MVLFDMLGMVSY